MHTWHTHTHFTPFLLCERGSYVGNCVGVTKPSVSIILSVEQAAWKDQNQTKGRPGILTWHSPLWLPGITGH